MNFLVEDEYLRFIDGIKEQIKNAQYKVLMNANYEQIILYWKIGQDLLLNDKWGSKFIDILAKDIKSSMPDLKGYSARNLRYMKKFASVITDVEFLQTVSAKLPWSHNIVLLDKLNDNETRKWYAIKTIENGWSVNVLEQQIATKLYDRQETNSKIQNFEGRLPSRQSELAIQTMKNPYIFDFVEFDEDMLETQLEKKLVEKITNLLFELGSGFAFMGNQYHLEVGGEDFYLDMLFYNVKLKCYVVIDLKTGKFTPEHAGKMNFYLSVVDDNLKGKDDNPSIGLILCRNDNKIIAEYALRDMTKPIGVSEYKFMQELPEAYRGSLPETKTIEIRMIVK